MTRILTTLLVLALVGCASAMPPAHKAFGLSVTVPAGVPVSAVVGYGANQADTNWTTLGSITATNGQTVALPLPNGVKHELYTATVVSAAGDESDYAPIWTNTIPTAPAAKVK